MDDSTLIINRVLPILILLGLGYWIRRAGFLKPETIEDLKKIVVNLALPAVLFISFLNIELQTRYLVIFVVIFGICVALLMLGYWIRRQARIEQTYFPFLTTGFEYGMLGISLFGSAYGLENIGYIAIVDLGHEIFIWFVFLALLLIKRDGLTQPTQLVGAFLTAPVIIGILAGIGFNILNAQETLYDSAITGALMSVLELLSNLTIPLILIIVGYGIQLDLSEIRKTAGIIGLRLGILIPLALLLNAVLIRELLDLEAAFEAALFTLFILPPPFIIPLYMASDAGDEKRYVNNVLMVYSVVTILIFTVYVAFNPSVS